MQNLVGNLQKQSGVETFMKFFQQVNGKTYKMLAQQDGLVSILFDSFDSMLP